MLMVYTTRFTRITTRPTIGQNLGHWMFIQSVLKVKVMFIIFALDVLMCYFQC